MEGEFEGRLVDGKITKFNRATSSGTVTVDDRDHAFHACSYSSRSARLPQPNDTVEVILAGGSLVEVREKRG